LDGGLPAAGIFHLANTGQCSWQEWGQFCVDEALARGLPLKAHHVDANRLEDIKAFTAPRPLNSVLDTGKFTAHTGITPRPWQEAMKEHFSTSPLFRQEESLV
jgi:dTDP-4-dehydrorhamnose reductase